MGSETLKTYAYMALRAKLQDAALQNASIWLPEKQLTAYMYRILPHNATVVTGLRVTRTGPSSLLWACDLSFKMQLLVP